MSRYTLAMRLSYKPFPTETALAQAFQAHWNSLPGHQSWPEVLGCDLVLFDGTRHLAVEAKLSFGLPVLEQAWKHVPHFAGSYVLVPHIPKLGKHICAGLNVGVFEMHAFGGTPRLHYSQDPRFNEHAVPPKLHLLTDDAKRWEDPGCPSPSGMSDWHARMLKLGRYAAKVPGLTLRELLNEVEPRYHKKSGRLLGPRRQDFDWISYSMRTGKCRTLQFTTDGKVEPTQWLIQFDAPSSP